ncbi:hypothetical protein [Limosilactobacillus sp.]|uniref:hypothetical protein n=1 Tax=Limosilactobacillus sp. TaxID=2773925 RepID=UPI003F10BAAD
MNKGFKIMLAVGLAGVSLATTTVVTNTNSSNTTVVQASKRSRIRAAVADMQDHFGDEADVYYDKENDVIAIKPTSQEFEDETIAVLDGEESESDWNDMTSALDDLSESLHDNLRIKTPLAIVNPENTDKVLYMTYNGETLYDVMNDDND